MQEERRGEERSGPSVPANRKRSRRYGKRILWVSLLAMGAAFFGIACQTEFIQKRNAIEEVPPNYQVPDPRGFRELILGMERQKKPISAVREEASPPPSQKAQIVVRASERVPERKYYSNQGDAQVAAQLRAMKVQAILTKPVIEDFARETEKKDASTVEKNQPLVLAPDMIQPTNALRGSQNQEQDPNGQANKREFLRGQSGGASMTPQGYSKSLPLLQQFRWELKAGTIVPGILITGINSDLPGTVMGQVSENVWDTATGRHILIPKGTKILGAYDSEVKFGQRRVLLVWNRLVFPNGTTLNIAGSPGVDQAGYSGMSGNVNEHWGKIFGTALFASAFVAGAEMIYSDENEGQENDKKSPGDVAAESVANSVLDMGAKILDKVTNIQPTIRIRSGKRFGIFIQEDVVFPQPYL